METVRAGGDIERIAHGLVAVRVVAVAPVHAAERVVDEGKRAVGQCGGTDAGVVVGQAVEQLHLAPGQSAVVAERSGDSGQLAVAPGRRGRAAEHLYAAVTVHQQGGLYGANLLPTGHDRTERPGLAAVDAEFDVAAPLSGSALRPRGRLFARRREDARPVEYGAVLAPEPLGQHDGLVLDGAEQRVGLGGTAGQTGEDFGRSRLETVATGGPGVAVVARAHDVARPVAHVFAHLVEQQQVAARHLVEGRIVAGLAERVGLAVGHRDEAAY